MKIKQIFFFLASIVTFITFSLQAQEITKEFIEDFAKKHVEKTLSKNITNDQKYFVSTQKLDPRIEIKQCDQPIVANILENQNSRNRNVKISCQTTPWHLFVPVKVIKKIPVLVASSNLQKGTVLNSNNTMIKYLADYKVRGETLKSAKTIIGARLKRNLQQSAAIYARNICLVCKGEEVTIIAKSATFEIKAAGIALSNGSIGEQVRIKNHRSGKIVSGRVNSLNNVLVNM